MDNGIWLNYTNRWNDEEGLFFVVFLCFLLPWKLSHNLSHVILKEVRLIFNFKVIFYISNKIKLFAEKLFLLSFKKFFETKFISIFSKYQIYRSKVFLAFKCNFVLQFILEITKKKKLLIKTLYMLMETYRHGIRSLVLCIFRRKVH